MNELDKRIREALREEDAELFEEFGEEPSLFEMSMQIFRGRNRWLTLLAMVWTLVFIGLGIWSAVKFFGAQDTRDMLKWAGACAFCMAAVAMIKLWSWLEINRNFIMREIKRIELQIAILAGRMKK
ncbi:MAG: DUF6768 family protein [Phycisphaerae bacterium]